MMQAFNYPLEWSHDYELLDVETGKRTERRLRTPNEAAELNAAMRHTGRRWVPAQTGPGFDTDAAHRRTWEFVTGV